MSFTQSQHRFTAAYGAGSGNTPALLATIGVGHLRAALLPILNNSSYENVIKRG